MMYASLEIVETGCDRDDLFMPVLKDALGRELWAGEYEVTFEGAVRQGREYAHANDFFIRHTSPRRRCPECWATMNDGHCPACGVHLPWGGVPA